MDIKIGAHLSIKGGYSEALKRIIKVGGNCLQIFSSSPQSWTMPKPSKTEIQKFLSTKKDLGIEPVYFHAKYLINLADKNQVGRLSKKSLVSDLNLASKLKIKGVIVHLGSFKDKKEEVISKNRNYPLLLENINFILKNSPQDTFFIIENSGTRKIGKSLEEIAQIIKDIKNKRIRVCLDTCHLYSAGYDLSSKKKLALFLKNFNSLIGIEKLELWHFNDSRDNLGSFRDRHENIGKGKIGLATFKVILNDPAMKKLPFIIETPGFDKNGPDAKNIAILKKLIKRNKHTPQNK